MKNRGFSVIQLFLIILGLLSLLFIIDSYGFDVLIKEFKTSGFQILWLSLTFIPTLFLYGISWLLMTSIDYKTRSDYIKWSWRFFLFSMISISWNNLTPFLKIGGEPVKYMLLSRFLSRKTALQSTVSYNLVHILATLLAFIIAACVTLIFYEVNFAKSLMIITFISLTVLMLFIWKLTNHSIWKFPTVHIFILSLITDTMARFIEGLTFYFAFKIINQHVSIIVCALLDVFRTFVDTLLFFIPYQLGGREAGIKLAMIDIYHLNDVSFLWPSMSYRFVEIIWIVVGYIYWIKWSSSSKSSTVSSA